jgi:hypothetical protein
MRLKTPALAIISAVISTHLLPSAVYAQAERRAPVISLSAGLGSSVVSNYIEPTIRLSEDAYVFAISVDVDRNVQVLHPDLPGLSVKMTSRKQLHLPSFFAGYGESGQRMANYASSYYDGFAYEPGFSDTRGTVIALASRKPFNLDAVTSDAAWDFTALRQLVERRDPLSAASALARYIGAQDEPIGRDVYRFAGAPRYYSSAYYDCHPVYGALGYGSFGYGSYGRGIRYFQVAALRQAGYVVQFIGIDACGEPRFAVFPGAVAPPPGGRPPAVGAFPKSRPGAFPKSRRPGAVSRNPARDETIADRMVRRARTGERYTERNATTTTRGRITERRAVDRSQPRPATGSFPDRARISERARVPERISPPPRANVPERRAAPPPAPRAVERQRPAPPPERPRPAESKRDQ